MRVILTATMICAMVLATPVEARKRKAARNQSYALHLPRGTATNGSCPCNGGALCTGPRGGRYCITSGGNKRYP